MLPPVDIGDGVAPTDHDGPGVPRIGRIEPVQVRDDIEISLGVARWFDDDTPVANRCADGRVLQRIVFDGHLLEARRIRLRALFVRASIWRAELIDYDKIPCNFHG
jgi:hypothetical protein